MKHTIACSLAVCLLLSGAEANAGVIMTLSASALDGDYDGGTNIFTATSDSSSFGDVTRNVATVGIAEFGDFATAGFVTGSADFNLTMTLTSIDANSADATGTWTWTDVDGTIISGDFTGNWARFGPLAIFTGETTDIKFTGNADGQFNGSTGGAFSTDFTGFAIEPFSGVVTEISSSTGWFDAGTFTGATTDFNAFITPEPGSALLAGIGLMMARRIRRRKTG